MHAIIFDIDGTLLRSAAVDDALYRQAVRQVLGDVRLRSSLHDYEFVTDTGILRQILADNRIDGDDPLVSIRSAFVDLLRAHVDAEGPFTEIPGARDLLDRLSASPQYAVATA